MLAILASSRDQIVEVDQLFMEFFPPLFLARQPQTKIAILVLTEALELAAVLNGMGFMAASTTWK